MSKNRLAFDESCLTDWIDIDGVRYYGPKYVKNLHQTAKNRLKEIKRLRRLVEETK